MSLIQACQGRAGRQHDRARSEYAAGATWHDLHVFASVSSTRSQGDDVGQLRGQLRIYLVISMLHYCSIIDTTLRNKFFLLAVFQ